MRELTLLVGKITGHRPAADSIALTEARAHKLGRWLEGSGVKPVPRPCATCGALGTVVAWIGYCDAHIPDPDARHRRAPKRTDPRAAPTEAE
jgi:hypothetical protein